MTIARTKKQKDVIAILQDSGMRMTKQRLGLVELLWQADSLGKDKNQHVSADKLFRLAKHAGLGLSLATVYNTLNRWADIGLLMRVYPALSKGNPVIYFDTNTSRHHHFFDEDETKLLDIHDDAIAVQNLPIPPKGKKINSVEVFVRINKNPLV